MMDRKGFMSFCDVYSALHVNMPQFFSFSINNADIWLGACHTSGNLSPSSMWPMHFSWSFYFTLLSYARYRLNTLSFIGHEELLLLNLFEIPCITCQSAKVVEPVYIKPTRCPFHNIHKYIITVEHKHWFEKKTDTNNTPFKELLWRTERDRIFFGMAPWLLISARSSAEGLLGVMRSNSFEGMTMFMSGSAKAELLDSDEWEAVSTPVGGKKKNTWN